MANKANPFFEEYFHKMSALLKHEGVIGDPNGVDAYAYLRVSTDGQAEEGRTGLPRQIEHVHELALEKGYRVTWESVYADDESGFTLERPALNDLLRDSLKPGRIANVVLCEELQRLSRNVDWHQGWLLEQLIEVRNMEVLFYNQYNSRIERMVFGAIGQDGMEEQKKKMKEGKALKAKQGYVTSCSKALFGYNFINNTGAKKQTQYEINEWAPLVEQIYRMLAFKNFSLRRVCLWLQETYPGVHNWEFTNVRQLIRNHAYYGMFTSNRFGTNVEWRQNPDGSKRKVRITYEKPMEEWTFVPVPPIVTKEVWDLANKALHNNKQVASRNGGNQNYLLTGLLKCASCGYSWNGFGTNKRKSRKNKEDGEQRYYWYRCTTRVLRKDRQQLFGIVCYEKAIRKEVLEQAVWNAIKKVMKNPQVLLDYLDSQLFHEENIRLLQQIIYLRQEEERADYQMGRHKRVFDSGGYDPEEYAELRSQYKAHRKKLEADIVANEARVITPEMVEQQKREIMEIADYANQYDLEGDVPFDVKKAVLKVAVRRVYINTTEGWIKIEGMVNGYWPLVAKAVEESLDNGGKKGAKTEANDVIVSSASRCRRCTARRQPGR